MCGSKTLPKWLLAVVCLIITVADDSPYFSDRRSGREELEPYLSVLTKGRPRTTHMFKMVRICNAAAERTAAEREDWQNLGFLLTNTADFKATDPRDRVYALLGMVRKADAVAIKADYTKPLGCLLEGVVKHLTKEDGKLHLPENRRQPAGLVPSWAPELLGTVYSDSCWRLMLGTGNPYNVSGNIPMDVDFVQDVHDATVLVTKGIWVGEIASVIGPFIFRLATDGDVDSVRESLPEWHQGIYGYKNLPAMQNPRTLSGSGGLL